MPKVSILCITYNQEKYIRQALESFVTQKTNFDFEILVHDDDSADGTQCIIKEFENKYPEKIKTFFQKENQYSKGVRGIMMKFLFPYIKGEYISICEGDDYFSNKNKLQIQVDFLDKNPDYSMCFHPARWFFENNEEPDSIFPDIIDGTEFTTERLLKENFINTNSVMYRRQPGYNKFSSKNISPGDWYLHLYHAKFGKIGFINKVMSAYRRHSGGIWWDSYKNEDELIKMHGVDNMSMYFELLRLYKDNEKYESIIFENIFSMLNRFVEIDDKYNSSLIKKVLVKFPDEMAIFLAKSLKDKDKYAKIKNVKTDACVSQLKLEEKDMEIRLMKSSKFWKLRSKYLKLKNIWNLQEKE